MNPMNPMNPLSELEIKIMELWEDIEYGNFRPTQIELELAAFLLKRKEESFWGTLSQKVSTMQHTPRLVE